MVLVGPSGCGKSTLLRLIAGLEQLTAGNIWVGDRLVNDLPPKNRDIAMVFQSYALYPHMTVYDNLAFGLRRTATQDPSDTKQTPLTRLQTALTEDLPVAYQKDCGIGLLKNVLSINEFALWLKCCRLIPCWIGCPSNYRVGKNNGLLWGGQWLVTHKCF
jgi:ABC-type transport system involved in cytochrome c biogenesis ATPase subunit